MRFSRTYQDSKSHTKSVENGNVASTLTSLISQKAIIKQTDSFIRDLITYWATPTALQIPLCEFLKHPLLTFSKEEIVQELKTLSNVLYNPETEVITFSLRPEQNTLVFYNASDVITADHIFYVLSKCPCIQHNKNVAFDLMNIQRWSKDILDITLQQGYLYETTWNITFSSEEIAFQIACWLQNACSNNQFFQVRIKTENLMDMQSFRNYGQKLKLQEIWQKKHEPYHKYKHNNRPYAGRNINYHIRRNRSNQSNINLSQATTTEADQKRFARTTNSKAYATNTEHTLDKSKNKQHNTENRNIKSSENDFPSLCDAVTRLSVTSPNSKKKIVYNQKNLVTQKLKFKDLGIHYPNNRSSRPSSMQKNENRSKLSPKRGSPLLDKTKHISKEHLGERKRPLRHNRKNKAAIPSQANNSSSYGQKKKETQNFNLQLNQADKLEEQRNNESSDKSDNRSTAASLDTDTDEQKITLVTNESTDVVITPSAIQTSNAKIQGPKQLQIHFGAEKITV